MGPRANTVLVRVRVGGRVGGGQVGAIADWPLPGCRTDLETVLNDLLPKRA